MHFFFSQVYLAAVDVLPVQVGLYCFCPSHQPKQDVACIVVAKLKRVVEQRSYWHFATVSNALVTERAVGVLLEVGLGYADQR